jgi:hypothetical protein
VTEAKERSGLDVDGDENDGGEPEDPGGRATEGAGEVDEDPGGESETETDEDLGCVVIPQSDAFNPISGSYHILRNNSGGRA